MKSFRNLFGRDGGAGDPPAMPWDQHPSIYEHIRAHTVPDRPGLTEGGERLPDEERVNEGGQIRWAPGALDGVLGHHMGPGGDALRVRRAVDLIRDYCENPTVTTKATLYQHLLEGNVLLLIDPMIKLLMANEQLNWRQLYELAHSLATEAPDREPVKLGIAILGRYQNPDNEELFQTLGRHEEFTLFCAVALRNMSDDPEQSLWRLAKNVEGWGRIHVVERLTQTQNPKIKDWLLREGYRNSVMYEYLAFACATAGGLLAALSEDTVDRELLSSAGEIIVALIEGGPAEDIDDYEDGALAVEMFMKHMESRAETLSDFLHIHRIREFLLDDEADWETRALRGWTTERRNALVMSCDRILNRPEWAERARDGLGSKDDREFYRASRVAEALEIDTWEIHWRLLQESPTDTGRWLQVMGRCDDSRIGDVMAFADQNIDLAAIGTGPAEELGLGREWQQHQCLDCILQELRRFPGIGKEYVSAGLRSAVVRNRNQAVAALSAWGDNLWGDELRGALEAAARIEPDEDLRGRMEKVLRGEPLDDD